MDACLRAAYHEAGHVVAAWMCDLPVEKAEINHRGEGVTRLKFWYRWTSMFREVNQETVRRNMLFVLAGECGEQLITLRTGYLTGVDLFLASLLMRRFCLDYAQLQRETEFMILRQQRVVALIAEELYRQSMLDKYQLSLHRMNWLARGRS